MPARRTQDEHTLSGAIIHWGLRPAPGYVWVTYPCCGRLLARSDSVAPDLRRPHVLRCRDCKVRLAVMAPKHGRQRARRQYPEIGLCEHCGLVPATDRHHKDGDTTNNARENVVFCCRRCHQILDGRRDALIARMRQFDHAKASWPPCVRCGDPDGRVHGGGRHKTPERISGARFGIDGQLCGRCYWQLSNAARRTP